MGPAPSLPAMAVPFSVSEGEAAERPPAAAVRHTRRTHHTHRTRPAAPPPPRRMHRYVGALCGVRTQAHRGICIYYNHMARVCGVCVCVRRGARSARARVCVCGWLSAARRLSDKFRAPHHEILRDFGLPLTGLILAHPAGKIHWVMSLSLRLRLHARLGTC